MEDAEARLAALGEERLALDRETITWKQIAERTRGLIEFYESRLRDPVGMERLSLGPGASSAESQPIESRREPAPPTSNFSVERFGKYVIPVADALITAQRGPVPVEDIYRAIPEEVRRDLDAGSTVYSTPFRIRRMFRRHRNYRVTEEGVTFVDLPTTPGSVTHFVRRDDGSIAAIAVVADGGNITYMKPAEVRDKLRRGWELRLPQINGRTSFLRLAGGRFYSEASGSENDDFFDVPEIPVRDVPALSALEHPGEIGDKS